MNRVFKKAISFITALGVSASICANTAFAVSVPTLSMTKGFSNKYPVAVGMSDSALFITKGSIKKTPVKTESVEEFVEGNEYPEVVTPNPYSGTSSENSYLYIPSDAKLTMVTSSGNKVKIENTVGFDRMFEICSGYYYNTIPIGEMYYEARGPVIAVGDGEKYNVLLENGKFLDEKTMYDSVSYSDGLITAVKGTTATYFTTTGTKLLTVKNNKYGSAISYSSTAKQIVFARSNAEEGWKNDYTVIDQSGKVIKIFKGFSSGYEFSYIKGKDGKTYLFRDGSGVYNGVDAYYDLTGKKVKESTVIQAHNYTLVADYDDKSNFIVKNNSGSVLLSIGGQKVSSGYVANAVSAASGDYLYVVTNDSFYVYNRAKGELVDKDLDHSFCLSVEPSDGGKSAILTLGKKIKSDWGEYMARDGQVVYTLSTKKMSEKYDWITPLYSNSPSSSRIAYLTEENEKYGLLDSVGNTTFNPYYSSTYYVDANIALMDNGTDCKVIINPQTGGWIPSAKDKTKASAVIPADCIVHKNVSHYPEDMPRSARPLGKRFYRVITSDSKGKKFGLVIFKYK